MKAHRIGAFLNSNTQRPCGTIAADARGRVALAFGVVALGIATIAPATRSARGALINYIVTADTTTDLSVTINHPGSVPILGATYPIQPPLAFWSVAGTGIDGTFTATGRDTVTIKDLTVQHTFAPHAGEAASGPAFAVPAVTVTATNLTGPLGFPLIRFAATAIHPGPPGHSDNVVIGGTYLTHGTILGGGDIDKYTFTVRARHGGASDYALAGSLVGQAEPVPVASTAVGSVAGLLDLGTNQLGLSIGMVGLQKADITDIRITSDAPGFTTLDLGLAGLVDGVDGVAFDNFVLIPLEDLNALENGKAFVNVMTHGHPSGELGGLLTSVPAYTVPEPAGLILLATGAAGLLCRKLWASG